MKKSLLRALAGVLLVAAQAHAQVTTIHLNDNSRGRVFEGLGAVSAGASSRLLIDYPEPYRSQVLDYLFKPNYGASLQHLKVEIGGDTNSTDGSEPSHLRSRDDLNFTRGYEWWLMSEAKKRNPNIALDSLAWGAPGWIGNGNYWSQDMADYVATWIEGAKSSYGLDIDFTGTWNEVWQGDPKEYAWIKLLRTTLDSHGLKTRIIAPDPHASNKEKMWNIIKVMEADPQLGPSVYAVGVHYPFDDHTVNLPEWARDSGYRLWSSEDAHSSDDWKGAEVLAARYNRNYIEGRITKTEIWSPVTAYYDNLAAPGSGLVYANSPWSGHYRVNPAVWITAHTTQFAQPGWRYIDSSCGYLRGGGSYVSLRSPESNDYSLIVETSGAHAPQELRLYIEGGLAKSAVHVWRTDANEAFQHTADTTPTGNSVSVALEADAIYSLTTTVGQGKGSAAPPVDSPFPFPYRDDFETTAVGGTPKFLSDQNGAFEVVNCRGRQGHCLSQEVTTKPIPWGIVADPYTYLGDPKWSDYEVHTDAMLDGKGEMTLLGRIDSADVFQDQSARWPSCYILTVNEKGEWRLSSTKYKIATKSLANGTVPFSSKTWHRFGLLLNGPNIEAAIDDATIAKVQDSTHSSGMAGIGSGWNAVEFDNFDIEPQSPTTYTWSRDRR